jgi:hypothetical protein
LSGRRILGIFGIVTARILPEAVIRVNNVRPINIAMLSRILALTLLASSIVAAEPDKLTKLRDSYEAAMSKATAPIQKTYVAELEKLKIEFTKAGNLEFALAVDAELKTLTGASPTDSNLTASPPVTGSKKSLSNREIEALRAALHGSWRLPNRSFGKFSSVWILGGEQSDYSVDRYGEVTITDSKGNTAKLRMAEDMKVLTGTWFDTSPIELKKIE